MDAGQQRQGSITGGGLVSTIEETDTIIQPFVVAIDAARPMLMWADDWDGAGSPGYRKATLDRARAFLLGGARELWEEHRLLPPVPRVSPGPDGSIDLHWRGDRRELLVNVPVGEDETISFYGDDAHTQIKGEIGRDVSAAWLFAWLAR
jgi:hypothetical protein